MKKVKGPILCLVGPPGVGKTSLGKSIARATGRNFVRMSLGGVRDEAEIRGHRRTYIGSMPGKVIQGMKKAKSSNPLFLLDEVDKLGPDWRGDPSSALLEVLDPEQNATFNDHYLEVDYDLSDVMFVTTANTLRMPQPLLDRMEIIRLPGYTEDEKVEIAKRHLLPKQVKEHGLKKGEWSISDDALRDLIRYYTREAGVRNLEREIANLARKAIKEILIKKRTKVRGHAPQSREVCRREALPLSARSKQRIWSASSPGLAWTEVGGELLSIEAVTLPGKGRSPATGKLGDVMKESVQAAESYVKSRSIAFGIKPTLFEKNDIHVHVPEGATPKDGPSAGVAMVTTIVSVLTGIPVRTECAMTGEITLRGRVLPIGGLKEKLLAALRGGLKTVLIPKENEKDLAEIPDNVKKGLTIIPVSTVDEVLKHALTKPLTPIEWTEPADPAPIVAPKGDEGHFDIGLRVLHEHIEIAILGKYARIDQFILGFFTVAPPILRNQLVVRKLSVRILVQHLHVAVRRRRIQIEVVLLHIFAVIPFMPVEPKKPLFQNMVAPIPHRQSKADELVPVADSTRCRLLPSGKCANGHGRGASIPRRCRPGCNLRGRFPIAARISTIPSASNTSSEADPLQDACLPPSIIAPFPIRPLIAATYRLPRANKTV